MYSGADRAAIQGLIITKELLQYVALLAPGAGRPAPRVGDLELRDCLRLPVSTPMYHLLDLFQVIRSDFSNLQATFLICLGPAARFHRACA